VIRRAGNRRIDVKSDIDRQIDELDGKIQALESERAALRRRRPRERVKDYELADWEGGRVRLSGLFGGRDRLILVHNMGKDCPFCTMWADGFVGYLPHLESRAAFVVTSPDEPRAQRELAESRGWTFPMLSAHGTSFVDDMGFLDPREGLMPGVSVFTKEPDGSIWRVARAEFGPGDDFCPVWHFFDLLPEGVAGWEPRFSYGDAPEEAELAAFPCCSMAREA
jgi:predicted dithiol-disulfide oxidoreductase (DUF899 family)